MESKQEKNDIVSIKKRNDSLLIYYSDDSVDIVSNEYAKYVTLPQLISKNIIYRNISLIASLIVFPLSVIDLIYAYANKDNGKALLGIGCALLSIQNCYNYRFFNKEVDNLRKYKIYLEMLTENEEALKAGYPSLDNTTFELYSIKALKKIKASLDEINETIKFEKKIKENRPKRTLGI